MKPKFSIAVPIHSKSLNTQVSYESESGVLDGVPNLGLWEIIAIVDNKKNDTLNHLIQINLQDSRFKVAELSRNFRKEATLILGIEFTSGCVIIPIDADLLDPPAVIHKLVKIWKETLDFVITICKERAGEAALKKGMACN